MTDVTKLVESIPAELRELPQWVVWRREERNGKPTKVPYRAKDLGMRASVSKPSTWSDPDAALSAWQTGCADGVGFVFTENDPFAGIDLDHCFEDGELHPDAAAIVAALNSYAERSPSGRGLHVLVRAELNGTRRRTGKTPWGGQLETYDRGRYFCVTGEPLPGAPAAIEPRQAELDALLGRMLPAASSPLRNENVPAVEITTSQSQPTPPETKLAALIDNSESFRGTWQRTRSEPSWSDSEWDMSLASQAVAAGWTDQEVCDLLVAGRQKHGGKAKPLDYYERTIGKARAGATGGEPEGGRGLVGYDPDTGKPVSGLERLNSLIKAQGSDVEFADEWLQIGKRRGQAIFSGSVRDKETDEAVEIGPFTQTQLRRMAELADAIWVAGGGELRIFARGKPGYVDFYRGLRGATRVEERDLDAGAVWRRRLARYVENRVPARGLAPASLDGRVHILEELHGEPFRDAEGRLWVNAEGFQEFFSHNRIVPSVPEIAEALRSMGFKSRPLQARLPSLDNRNRKLTYWRSSASFDPKGEG
ncbi:MAG: hypothetical protein AABM42_03090 [Actinomycetota bacterium]